MAKGIVHFLTGGGSGKEEEKKKKAVYIVLLFWQKGLYIVKTTNKTN